MVKLNKEREVIVEKSVSLLIMTRLQMEEGEPEELVAILQRRGEFNHETMRPESWPGACQLTVHGKVEEDENEKNTLFRETVEELGQDFVLGFMIAMSFKMVEIGEVLTEKKHVQHYAVEVLPDRLKSIRFNASTGGVRIMRYKDLDRIQNLFMGYIKEKGIELRSATAMFPDEIKAVKKAFEIFGRASTGGAFPQFGPVPEGGTCSNDGSLKFADGKGKTLTKPEEEMTNGVRDSENLGPANC
jgi:hypothetical protein